MAGVASTVAKAALAPQEETEPTERTAEQREYQQPYYETANDLFGSSTSQASGGNGGQSNHQYPQEQQQQQSYGSSFASGFFSRVAASFLSTETSDSSSSSSDSTYPANAVEELNSDAVRSEQIAASTQQPMTAGALFSGSNDAPTQQMNDHEPQQFHQHQQQQQPVNMFNPLVQVPQMHQAGTSNHFQQQQHQSQMHQVQQQMHQPQAMPQRIFNPVSQTQATFGPPSLFGVPQRASTSAPSRSRYAQPAPVFVASDSLQQKTSASLLWG